MSIQLEYTHVDSFEAVTLANDAMRIVVVPELGGKIISLQSRASGREWLWRNPHLSLRLPPAGSTNFGLFDAGGWDEMFPTVDPCRVPDSAWGNRTLTDHGELWYRPWQMLEADIVPNELALLTLAVDEPELPFRFERTLTLPDGAGPLMSSYELINRSDRPMPYIWAAHPLLAIEPGGSIRLPSETRISSTGSVGLEFAADAAVFNWPIAGLASGEKMDFSHIPVSGRDVAFAVKLFAEDVLPAGIEIVDQCQREFIRFCTLPTDVRHIGLWLNYGAWSGADTRPYFNAGIEPTISPNDDLSIAIRRRSEMRLLPGETRRWQLSVTIGALRQPN